MNLYPQSPTPPTPPPHTFPPTNKKKTSIEHFYSTNNIKFYRQENLLLASSIFLKMSTGIIDSLKYFFLSLLYILGGSKILYLYPSGYCSRTYNISCL